MATSREDIHRLLDTVPDDQLAEVADFIAKRSDTALLAALDAYRGEHARGETIPHEQVMRELGL